MVQGQAGAKLNQEFQLEKMKIDNAFNIAKMNAQTDEQRNLITQEHYRALEGLQAQQNANTQQANFGRLAAEFNPLNLLPKPKPPAQPGFAESQFGLLQALKQDPGFQQFFDREGKFQTQNIPPELQARYQQYLEQFGMPTSNLPPYYLGQ